MDQPKIIQVTPSQPGWRVVIFSEVVDSETNQPEIKETVRILLGWGLMDDGEVVPLFIRDINYVGLFDVVDNANARDSVFILEPGMEYMPEDFAFAKEDTLKYIKERRAKSLAK